MDLKNLVPNIISVCILILLFLIAFTWIIFEFSNSSNSLKDSLSIVSSLFGGIATLAAAYVGSMLFNDWKEQHNKTVISSLSQDLLITISKDIELIVNIFSFVKGKDPNIPLTNEKILLELLNKIEDVNKNCMLISSKALTIYDLTNDEDFNSLRFSYHHGMNELLKIIHKVATDGNTTGFLANYLNGNMKLFTTNNKTYKNYVVKFIMAS